MYRLPETWEIQARAFMYYNIYIFLSFDLCAVVCVCFLSLSLSFVRLLYSTIRQSISLLSSENVAIANTHRYQMHHVVHTKYIQYTFDAQRMDDKFVFFKISHLLQSEIYIFILMYFIWNECIWFGCHGPSVSAHVLIKNHIHTDTHTHILSCRLECVNSSIQREYTYVLYCILYTDINPLCNVNDWIVLYRFVISFSGLKIIIINSWDKNETFKILTMLKIRSATSLAYSARTTDIRFYDAIQFY